MASAWIIQTGCANVASVCAAFRRMGGTPRVTADAAVLAAEPLVVLPGVGAFGAAMRSLRASGLDATIRERVGAGRPLLAICLGLQLLCEASDESPGVDGLSVVTGAVRRFAGEVRVPQMGWNRVAPTAGAVLLREDAFYFANSYALAGLPPGWEGATSSYSGAFVAALERGALLACQFHPELSGRAGLDLLRRWMDLALSSGVGVSSPAIVARGGASAAARPATREGTRSC